MGLLQRLHRHVQRVRQVVVQPQAGELQRLRLASHPAQRRGQLAVQDTEKAVSQGAQAAAEAAAKLG